MNAVGMGFFYDALSTCSLLSSKYFWSMLESILSTFILLPRQVFVLVDHLANHRHQLLPFYLLKQP